MRTTTILTSLLVVVPAVAAAEGVLKEPRAPDIQEFDFVAAQAASTDLKFVRQLVPDLPSAAVAQSRIIYLNKDGVTLSPGYNDSRTNRSTLVSSTRQVPAWNASATTWNATVSCLKDMFSRWDVTVTDVNPGNVPHIEAVFTGSPSSIGMGSGVGGVSPFTQNCGIIENSIVFTFVNAIGTNPQALCEVMAQEIAHSYGLDHEMLASDPMTYLNYNGKRTFKDQTVSCGEYQNRPCGIGGSVCRPNQNSVQLLNERLGLADAIAPTMAITAPQDGAIVQPGFAVQATAMDNVGVKSATLKIDGQQVAMTPGPGPYTFATDATLAEGAHTVTVEVTDGKNTQTQTINVTVQLPGGGGDGDDAGSGDGEGTGGGTDTDGDGDVDEDDMNGGGGAPSTEGGCSSGRGVGFALGLFVLAQIVLRRRRYA